MTMSNVSFTVVVVLVVSQQVDWTGLARVQWQIWNWPCPHYGCRWPFPFLALRFDHRCHGAEIGLSCSLFAQSECSTTVRYAMPPQCAVSHVMTSSLRAALPPVIWCPLLHQTEVSTRLLVHFAPNRNKHLFSFRVTSHSMHSFSYSFYADLK